MKWLGFFKLPFNYPFFWALGELFRAENWCWEAPPRYCQPCTELDHIREEHFLGESASFFGRPGRVTVKFWLLLGMIWEEQGLRQLGRSLKLCFFPVQPFLVDRAVRESHECLASAPLYVFPAFVIELFLSISGFFTHTTWGFVCSSMLNVWGRLKAQPWVCSSFLWHLGPRLLGWVASTLENNCILEF